MFDPNYKCLIGLIPFLYASIFNDYNFNSLSILFFGILYHGNKNNLFLRYIDIVQCILNGSMVYYYNYASRIYGILALSSWLINNYYFNNDYLHIFTQLVSWRGISLYENALLN